MDHHGFGMRVLSLVNSLCTVQHHKLSCFDAHEFLILCICSVCSLVWVDDTLQGDYCLINNHAVLHFQQISKFRDDALDCLRRLLIWGEGQCNSLQELKGCSLNLHMLCLSLEQKFVQQLLTSRDMVQIKQDLQTRMNRERILLIFG